jgi:hypothetical protein
MVSKTEFVLIGCLFLVSHGAAGGLPVGTPTGFQVGVDMITSAGGAVPLGVGGIAAITALSLIIGTQLIKRRK